MIVTVIKLFAFDISKAMILAFVPQNSHDLFLQVAFSTSVCARLFTPLPKYED